VKHLSAYLHNVHCTLQSLEVSNTQLSDANCALLMTSLLRNTSLTTLDISSNDLGLETMHDTSEIKATASEVLGALIRQVESKLTHLNVKYSRIHRESVLDICDSVCDCQSLISLNLGDVIFGKDASVVLGSAITENTTIR
jgi:Ran GTPase-activating protein (RanGAP) involved in mRNA processing and transport